MPTHIFSLPGSDSTCAGHERPMSALALGTAGGSVPTCSGAGQAWGWLSAILDFLLCDSESVPMCGCHDDMSVDSEQLL